MVGELVPVIQQLGLYETIVQSLEIIASSGALALVSTMFALLLTAGVTALVWLAWKYGIPHFKAVTLALQGLQQELSHISDLIKTQLIAFEKLEARVNELDAEIHYLKGVVDKKPTSKKNRL
jgi:hypothetical protein